MKNPNTYLCPYLLCHVQTCVKDALMPCCCNDRSQWQLRFTCLKRLNLPLYLDPAWHLRLVQLWLTALELLCTTASGILSLGLLWQGAREKETSSNYLIPVYLTVYLSDKPPHSWLHGFSTQVNTLDQGHWKVKHYWTRLSNDISPRCLILSNMLLPHKKAEVNL